MEVTGDATLGGYFAQHARPPAFEGSDGEAYSAEFYCDGEPTEDGRYGAAVLFVRWPKGGEEPVGHLETEYLSFGATVEEARSKLGELTLHEVKRHLDRLIERRREITW